MGSRSQSNKINLVLKKSKFSKLGLNSLTVHYLNIDLTTVLLQLELR